MKKLHISTAVDRATRIEKLAEALNAEIVQAAKIGMQVSIDVDSMRSIEDIFEVPIIRAACRVDPKSLDVSISAVAPPQFDGSIRAEAQRAYIRSDKE